jgi:hypothetical protein
MKAIRASLTGFRMGSFVAPSNVRPLMTVVMTTPYVMKRWMTSVTSA